MADWLKQVKADVMVTFYNNHANSFFFVLEKFARVTKVSDLQVYASMRGESPDGIPSDTSSSGLGAGT